MLKLLFIGEQWFGSDSRSLCHALRRIGHIVESVDPCRYFPETSTILSKVISKLSYTVQCKAFNDVILEKDSLLEPDFIFVFKGRDVNPHTLLSLRQRGRQIAQFYPDVSLYTHGRFIPEAAVHYDIWFTTKSYGIQDVKLIAPHISCKLVHHAFDPDVHRPVHLKSHGLQKLEADVSFIGTWDTDKEETLAYVVNHLPQIKVKIWGSQWERATTPCLKEATQMQPVIGDMYSACITQSKINLAILSGRKRGASSGDMVTARTFQIPAASGFMLHQRTDEAIKLFQEDVHCGYFSDPAELVKKIKYYLQCSEQRDAIRLAGYTHALTHHSMDSRAREISLILESHLHNV